MEIPTCASLFLRNARLLDLDLLPDWPGISMHTFSTGKNAHPSSSQCLRSAEWILVRLFEIWDAKGTKRTLADVFQSSELRQSTKLRSVLYQMLEALKKTGVLGRQCLLRRSMLDECRGDKFEELLFLFSTAVLHRSLDSKTKYRDVPVSQQRANNTTSELRDAEWMQPLLIAHGASLQSSLRHRRSFRSEVRAFELALTGKKIALKTRRQNAEELLEKKPKLLAQASTGTTNFEKQLQDDLLADHKWLTAIMCEHGVDYDVLLEDSFENAWKHTRFGEDVRVAQMPVDLVGNLKERIEEQQARLERWQKLQHELSSRNESRIVLKSPVKSPSRSPMKTPIKREVNSPVKGTRKIVAVVFDGSSQEWQDSDPTTPSYGPAKDAKPKASYNTPRARILSPSSGAADRHMFSARSKAELILPEGTSAITSNPPSNDLDNLRSMVRPGNEQAAQSLASLPESREKSAKHEDGQSAKSRQEMAQSRTKYGSADLISRHAQHGSPHTVEHDNVVPEASPDAEKSSSAAVPQIRSSLIERTRQSLCHSNSPRLNLPSTMSGPQYSHNTPNMNQSSRPAAPTDRHGSLSERAQKSLLHSYGVVMSAERTKRHHDSRLVHLQNSFPVNPCESSTSAGGETQRTFGETAQVTGRGQKSVNPSRRNNGGTKTPPEQLLDGDTDCASVFKTRSRVRRSLECGSIDA